MDLKPQFRAKQHHTVSPNQKRRRGAGLSMKSRDEHLTQDTQTDQRAAADTNGRGAPTDSYLQFREWKSQINKKPVESISVQSTKELKVTEPTDTETGGTQEVESFHSSEKIKKAPHEEQSHKDSVSTSVFSSSWNKDEDDAGSRVSFGVSIGNGMTVNNNGTIGFDFGTGISLNSDGTTSFKLSAFG